MDQTTVDLDKLRDALRWLRDTKATVDAAIERAKTIPQTVGGAPINQADPHGTSNRLKTVAAPGGTGTVPGLVTEVGPTHFGIFDSARQVAAKHAGVYNSVLQGLSATAQDLDNALKATQYMIDNYAKAEQVNAGGMSAILADPSNNAGAGTGGGL